MATLNQIEANRVPANLSPNPRNKLNLSRLHPKMGSFRKNLFRASSDCPTISCAETHQHKVRNRTVAPLGRLVIPNGQNETQIEGDHRSNVRLFVNGCTQPAGS
jgi:hypothetical protein